MQRTFWHWPISYLAIALNDRRCSADRFSAVQRLLLIPALVLAFVPIVASLCTQDFQLIRVQNIVEAKDVTGEVVEDAAKQRSEPMREKADPEDV
jgi:hypothetical protein